MPGFVCFPSVEGLGSGKKRVQQKIKLPKIIQNLGIPLDNNLCNEHVQLLSVRIIDLLYSCLVGL